jgi:hypothetical protein
MATTTLNANGSTAATVVRDVGQVFCVTSRGSLGGGTLNVKLTASGGSAKTIETYTASDLNDDNTLSFKIDVAANNSLQIELTGATSPSVVIDVDPFETLRTN